MKFSDEEKEIMLRALSILGMELASDIYYYDILSYAEADDKAAVERLREAQRDAVANRYKADELYDRIERGE